MILSKGKVGDALKTRATSNESDLTISSGELYLTIVNEISNILNFKINCFNSRITFDRII